MIRPGIVMLLAVACTTSESERARHVLERSQSRDSLRTTEVVQSLMTSTSPGRLIYERPANLSYDSLPLKRPDLVLTADRRKR